VQMNFFVLLNPSLIDGCGEGAWSKLRELQASVKVTMSGNHPNKSPGCLENKGPENREVKGPGSPNNHQAPTQTSNQQPGVLAVSEL